MESELISEEPYLRRIRINLKKMRSLKVILRRIDDPLPSVHRSSKPSKPQHQKTSRAQIDFSFILNSPKTLKLCLNRVKSDSPTHSQLVSGIQSSMATSAAMQNLKSKMAAAVQTVQNVKSRGGIPTSVKAYECKYCPSTFAALNSLRAHMKTIHPNHASKSLTFTCQNCGSTFPNRLMLKLHSRIHSGSGTGSFCQCRYCESSFAIKKYLRKHIKRMHPDEYHTSLSEIPVTYPCQICEKSFQSEMKLKLHETNHVKERKFRCAHCPSTYCSMYKFRTHMKQFHPEEHVRTDYSLALPCTICGLLFENNRKLKLHSRIHTGGNVFPCKICVSLFGTRKTLQVHMRRVHPEQNNTQTAGVFIFPCSVCGMKFQSQLKLKLHSRLHNDRKLFSCKFCVSIFRSIYVLRAHQKKNHPDQAPISFACTCNICGLKCENQFKLNLHSRIHTGQKLLLCKYCPSSFSQHHSLRKHLKTRHPERDHKLQACKTCGLKFQNKIKLRIHERIHLVGNTVVNCKICVQPFSTNQTLHKHMRIFHPEHIPTYSCTICNQEFQSSMKMKLHSRIHDSSLDEVGRKLFPCKYCASVFSSIYILRSHEKKNHPEQEPSHLVATCTVCGLKFDNQLKLKLHSRIHANGNEVFSCEFCSSTFSVIYDHSEHIKTVHPERNQNLSSTCTTCGLIFESKSKLNSHLRIHSEKNVVSCLICALAFSTRHTLRSHMKNLHPGHAETEAELARNNKSLVGEKIWFCKSKDCGLKFDTQLKLNLHKRTHSREAAGFPYPCKVCGTRFKNIYTLQKHLKKVHPEHGPSYFMWPCRTCDLEFQNRNKLKLHSRVHTSGEGEVFPCEICGACFRNKHYFNSHLRSVHPAVSTSSAVNDKIHRMKTRERSGRTNLYTADTEKVYTCRLCGLNFETEIKLNGHVRAEHSENVTSIVDVDILDLTDTTPSSKTKNSDSPINENGFDKAVNSSDVEFPLNGGRVRDQSSAQDFILNPDRIAKYISDVKFLDDLETKFPVCGLKNIWNQTAIPNCLVDTDTETDISVPEVDPLSLDCEIVDDTDQYCKIVFSSTSGLVKNLPLSSTSGLVMDLPLD